MSDAALRPDFFNSLPTVVKEKQAKEAGVTPEELELYALFQSGGWKALKGFILELVDDLEQVTESGMASGASLEEIGRNAVVANLAKGVIKRILDKVEDARQASERPNGTTK